MFWSRLNSQSEKLYLHLPIVSPPLISVNTPPLATRRKRIRFPQDAGHGAHQDYAGFPSGFEEDGKTIIHVISSPCVLSST